MDAADVVAELRRHRTIDITTIGARTGRRRLIETWAWVDGETVYLTGSPGRRDWYANLLAHSGFTIHLKRALRADIPARAVPIVDREQRRAVFARIHPADADTWTDGSPLVEVDFS